MRLQDILFNTVAGLPGLHIIAVSACHTSPHRAAVEAAILLAMRSQRPSTTQQSYQLNPVEDDEDDAEPEPAPAPVVPPAQSIIRVHYDWSFEQWVKLFVCLCFMRLYKSMLQ